MFKKRLSRLLVMILIALMFLSTVPVDNVAYARTNISAAQITVKDIMYSGSDTIPEIVVKYDGDELVEDEDYSLVFSNNDKVGNNEIKK